MKTVLGVYARANHPEGYGFCQGLDMTQGGQHQGAKAHGYVVLVVACKSPVELDAVTTKLAAYEFDDERKPLPGFDPWQRGDAWYAGPYELVWSAEVELHRAFGMTGAPLVIGDRPSYGDNRALAYLTADEVLGKTDPIPTPAALWRQAREEHPDNPNMMRAHYRGLMIQHGHIV